MNSKKVSSVLIVLLIVHWGPVAAQSTFQKTYGGLGFEVAYACEAMSDGGMVLAGTSSSTTSDDVNIYVLRLDANGDTLWTRTYGGNGYASTASIHRTSDDGFVLCGSVAADSESYWKAFILKITDTGEILWSTFLGDSDHVYGEAVQQLSNGNFILTGIHNNTSGFDNDIFLAFVESDGTVTWTNGLGGSNHDEAFAIVEVTDSGYMVAATTNSSGQGNADICVIRTNEEGDTLWTRTYGGPEADYVSSIVMANDDGFLISGNTLSAGAGIWDTYLMKIDGSGDLIWTKTYGGTGVEYGAFLVPTGDGGFLFGGSTNSFGGGGYDYFLVKTSADGEFQWSKTYGGAADEYAYAVSELADGGYAISGYSQSFNAENYELYLVKTDSEGNAACNESTPVIAMDAVVMQEGSSVLVPFSIDPTLNESTWTLEHLGEIHVLCTGDGVSEVLANTLSVQMNPNPCSGTVFISSNSILNHIQVSDMTGRIVFESELHEWNIRLDLPGPGMYCIMVASGNLISSQRVLVTQ